MPNITESSSEEISAKRTPRCSGCSTPLSEHDWGIPSKFCEGQEKSSPSKHAATTYADIDAEIVALEEEMAELDLEEEKRAKLCKVDLLRRQVKEKKSKLQAAAIDNEGQDGLKHFPGASNIADMRKAIPSLTPLDGLLQHLDPAINDSIAGGNHLPSLNGQVPPVTAVLHNGFEARTSEMFLKPANLPKGEKILRIIDFVDNIVRREDERTLSDVGNTKIVVSYGPKKPRLEHYIKLP